jgi:hypothetical protein
MPRKRQVKTVEGEAFDEEVPDPDVVDEDAFAALQQAWLDEETGDADV